MFLIWCAHSAIMVSRLDLVLVIGLYPGLSALEIARKAGKKKTSYGAVYQLLQKLKVEGLVNAGDEKYTIAQNQKAAALFRVVYFCFGNSVDYNRVISVKTAEFVKLGFEKGLIEGLPFDAKTVRGIVSVLSRHGFAVVESRKPFVCRIVYSKFLQKLVGYFEGKVTVACPQIADCIDEASLNSRLEKEFSAYRRAARELPSFDETGFIHSSLALEGNTLTLSETERLIRDNISPVSKPFKDCQEVLDYKKALDKFLHGAPINEEALLVFHRTAMNSLASGAGQVRGQNVRIRGNPDFKTPDYQELPSLLASFYESANKLSGEKKLSAVQLVETVAFLHNEFQRIHPFIDGNSRTSRAIFTKILVERGFPLIKIPVGFSDQYMGLTKLSQRRDDKKFALLMKLIVLENLKMASRKLEFE